MSKQPTLNQILDAMNLTTRPSGKMYRKNIIDADGNVVLESVTAHEVWAWLGRGELWQSGDSLELAIQALRHERARVEARIIEASEYGLDTTALEDRMELLDKQFRAMDKAMEPIREEEKAQDLKQAHEEGCRAGLLEDPNEYPADLLADADRWAGNEADRDYGFAWAEGYLEGLQTGDDFPLLRVEAIRAELRHWEGVGPECPDSVKQARIRSLEESLEMTEARIRRDLASIAS